MIAVRGPQGRHGPHIGSPPRASPRPLVPRSTPAYHGGPMTPPEYEVDFTVQAVENLVTQFSSALDFYRELVQNSIDAGSAAIDVWMEFLPASDSGADEGTIVIHVDDAGEGMNEAIIDQQLTRLFASSKDGDLTKIGKFGIGFVSIFAPDPRAVLLHTGRGGEAWEVLFHPDRSFTKTRLGSPVEGTQIALYLAGDRARAAEAGDLDGHGLPGRREREGLAVRQRPGRAGQQQHRQPEHPQQHGGQEEVGGPADQHTEPEGPEGGPQEREHLDEDRDVKEDEHGPERTHERRVGRGHEALEAQQHAHEDGEELVAQHPRGADGTQVREQGVEPERHSSSPRRNGPCSASASISCSTPARSRGR